MLICWFKIKLDEIYYLKPKTKEDEVTKPYSCKKKKKKVTRLVTLPPFKKKKKYEENFYLCFHFLYITSSLKRWQWLFTINHTRFGLLCHSIWCAWLHSIFECWEWANKGRCFMLFLIWSSSGNKPGMHLCSPKG